MGKCPHKSPSPCNTYVIPMSLYKFVSSYVTHTHTHTHTQSSGSAASSRLRCVCVCVCVFLTCSMIQPMCVTSRLGCRALSSALALLSNAVLPVWTALYQAWAMAWSLARRNTHFFLSDDTTSKYLQRQKSRLYTASLTIIMPYLHNKHNTIIAVINNSSADY